MSFRTWPRRSSGCSRRGEQSPARPRRRSRNALRQAREPGSRGEGSASGVRPLREGGMAIDAGGLAGSGAFQARSPGRTPRPHASASCDGPACGQTGQTGRVSASSALLALEGGGFPSACAFWSGRHRRREGRAGTVWQLSMRLHAGTHAGRRLPEGMGNACPPSPIPARSGRSWRIPRALGALSAQAAGRQVWPSPALPGRPVPAKPVRGLSLSAGMDPSAALIPSSGRAGLETGHALPVLDLARASDRLCLRTPPGQSDRRGLRLQEAWRELDSRMAQSLARPLNWPLARQLNWFLVWPLAGRAGRRAWGLAGLPLAWLGRWSLRRPLGESEGRRAERGEALRAGRQEALPAGVPGLRQRKLLPWRGRT